MPVGEFVPGWPYNWNPWYDNRPILPRGCEHCYCEKAIGFKDHMQCCKCKDRLHKNFVAGGTVSANDDEDM